jgi:hypothetical protein
MHGVGVAAIKRTIHWRWGAVFASRAGFPVIVAPGSCVLRAQMMRALVRQAAHSSARWHVFAR